MVYRNCITLLNELTAIEQEILRIKQLLTQLDINLENDEIVLKVLVNRPKKNF